MDLLLSQKVWHVIAKAELSCFKCKLQRTLKMTGLRALFCFVSVFLAFMELSANLFTVFFLFYLPLRLFPCGAKVLTIIFCNVYVLCGVNEKKIYTSTAFSLFLKFYLLTTPEKFDKILETINIQKISCFFYFLSNRLLSFDCSFTIGNLSELHSHFGATVKW